MTNTIRVAVKIPPPAYFGRRQQKPNFIHIKPFIQVNFNIEKMCH